MPEFDPDRRFSGPHLTVNRKYVRTQAVVGHAMHLLRPFLQSGSEKAATRMLLDFFDSQGAQLITEADRIAAGLPPRDHNGMTLEELVFFETKLCEAMLNAARPPIYLKAPIPPSEQITCHDHNCPIFGKTMFELKDGCV